MRKLILSSIIFVTFIIISPVVNAQQQDFNFSGNDFNSYQCFDNHGNLITANTHTEIDSSGNSIQTPVFADRDAEGKVIEFYCKDSEGNRIKAVLKPPAFQELEILFVRVVYAIWALIGSFSFLMIIYLGYQYLISRGDATQVKAIRERIIKFIIGFALVFLAVPILVTFFRLLGINNEVQCYSGLSGTNNIGIGFQFFFTELCTDGGGKRFEACDNLTSSAPRISVGSFTGLACQTNGELQTCTTTTKTYFFRCENQVWKYTGFSNV